MRDEQTRRKKRRRIILSSVMIFSFCSQNENIKISEDHICRSSGQNSKISFDVCTRHDHELNSDSSSTTSIQSEILTEWIHLAPLFPHRPDSTRSLQQEDIKIPEDYQRHRKRKDSSFVFLKRTRILSRILKLILRCGRRISVATSVVILCISRLFFCQPVLADSNHPFKVPFMTPPNVPQMDENAMASSLMAIAAFFGVLIGYLAFGWEVDVTRIVLFLCPWMKKRMMRTPSIEPEETPDPVPERQTTSRARRMMPQMKTVFVIGDEEYDTTNDRLYVGGDSDSQEMLITDKSRSDELLQNNKSLSNDILSSESTLSSSEITPDSISSLSESELTPESENEIDENINYQRGLSYAESQINNKNPMPLILRTSKRDFSSQRDPHFFRFRYELESGGLDMPPVRVPSKRRFPSPRITVPSEDEFWNESTKNNNNNNSKNNNNNSKNAKKDSDAGKIEEVNLKEGKESRRKSKKNNLENKNTRNEKKDEIISDRNFCGVTKVCSTRKVQASYEAAFSFNRESFESKEENETIKNDNLIIFPTNKNSSGESQIRYSRIPESRGSEWFCPCCSLQTGHQNNCTRNEMPMQMKRVKNTIVMREQPSMNNDAKKIDQRK